MQIINVEEDRIGDDGLGCRPSKNGIDSTLLDVNVGGDGDGSASEEAFVVGLAASTAEVVPVAEGDGAPGEVIEEAPAPADDESRRSACREDVVTPFRDI